MPNSPCVLGQGVLRVISERLGPVLASVLQYFSSYGSLKVSKGSIQFLESCCSSVCVEKNPTDGAYCSETKGRSQGP